MSKIKLTNVSTGILFVEVEEAGLRMLCGSPADSVKQLIKKGLITKVQKGELNYETGPNAILLSDVLIQNGGFANLSEFPVLQMLYLQGMVIPNHPNNNGTKPLILGCKDQVSAQMQYIFRGNYGLISKEELMDAGVGENQANLMMALKLKFAFGKILESKALLNDLEIAQKREEIMKGVFIERKALNVFDITYKGESVEVDLNLKPNQMYEPPYLLSFHQIKREYFAVIHSGEGDGWDANRCCMASILMFQGKMYLIDAGPNILFSLQKLGISISEIEGIFHTHSHDDHCAGLTSLLYSDQKIKYYATPMVRSSVFKKLAALLSLLEENLYDYFEVFDLKMGVWNNVNQLEVMPIFSPHPVETNVFTFRAKIGNVYKTYSHFADIISLRALQEMVNVNKGASAIPMEFYDEVKQSYLEPVDLKKIDVGGGMIHGDAFDFEDDTSTKIILSHTSVALTSEQKKVGSESSFGVVDVLIPSFQNYLWRYAFQFLGSNFPTIDKNNMRQLLNNPVVLFNPSTVLIKENNNHNYIYLLLTGSVEKTQSQKSHTTYFTSGDIIGDLSGLKSIPSGATYRATNYVEALRIDSKMYLEFVKSNGIFDEIIQMKAHQEFLNQTWLLGEFVSFGKQKMIAKSIHYAKYKKGETIPLAENVDLHLIKSGNIQFYLAEEIFGVLKKGDFFGEDSSLFGTPCLFNFKVIEDVEIYKIPAEILKKIPIVHWRLYETFMNNMEMLISRCNDNIPFKWRDEYSVNIFKIDAEHKKIFQVINSLIFLINGDREPITLSNALNFLITYTINHLEDEEKVMEQYQYPELEEHKQQHQILVKQIMELKEKLINSGFKDAMNLLEFFKNWVLKHTISVDRKYHNFLNSKGVY